MPKGNAVILSPADLVRAADITDKDIDAARRAWKRDTTPRFRALVDAKAIKDEGNE